MLVLVSASAGFSTVLCSLQCPVPRWYFTWAWFIIEKSMAVIRPVISQPFPRICPQQLSIYSSISLLYTHLSSVHGGHPFSHQPAFPPHASVHNNFQFIHLSAFFIHICIWQPSILSSVSFLTTHLSIAAICSVISQPLPRICPQQPYIYSSVSLLYTHLSMATIHFQLSAFLLRICPLHSHPFSLPAFTPHLSTATFHLFICQPSLYASVHGNNPLSIVSIPSMHLSTTTFHLFICHLSFHASVHGKHLFIHLSVFFVHICPRQPSIHSSVDCWSPSRSICLLSTLFIFVSACERNQREVFQ